MTSERRIAVEVRGIIDGLPEFLPAYINDVEVAMVTVEQALAYYIRQFCFPFGADAEIVVRNVEQRTGAS